MNLNFLKILILFSLAIPFNLYAKKQTKQEITYLEDIFGGSDIVKKRTIVKADTKKKLKRIKGDKYKKAIFSYWALDEKTIWILNSIGKYKPITAGFIVNDCKVESAKVLVYREQHGYEIKYPSFLSQFNGVTLKSNIKLNKGISNISGATLSVNSMDRMARVALLLNSTLNEKKCT